MSSSRAREFLLELARPLGLNGPARALAEGARLAGSGFTPAAQSLAVVLLHRITSRPVVAITADNAGAERRRQEIAVWQRATQTEAEPEALVFPAFEVDPYEGLSPHEEILEEQAIALWQAARGVPFLVAPAVAIAARLAPAAEYRELGRSLRQGESHDLENLTEFLTLAGYRSAPMVEMPGQFARRGGLLDIFSPAAGQPARLEFFGDELESLRYFDAATQRSTQNLEQLTIPPLTPIRPTAERARKLSALMQSPVSSDDYAPAEALFPGWEVLAPAAENWRHSVLDLNPNALVIVLEPEAVASELNRWWQKLQLRAARVNAIPAPDPQLKADGASQISSSPAPRFPAPERIFHTPGEVSEAIELTAGIELRELALEELDLEAEVHELRADVALQQRTQRLRGRATPALPADGDAAAGCRLPPAESRPRWSIHSRPAPRIAGGLEAMMAQLRRYSESGRRLLLLSGNEGERQRLAELLREHALPYELDPSAADAPGPETHAAPLLLATGELLRGFELPRAGISILGTGDLWRTEAEAAVPERPARASRLGSFLGDFRDLKAGDYVVHVEHGIGRYLGLTQVETPGDSGEPGEFMLLEYAERAKLYVPLTRLDLVQKYRSAEGAEGAEPALDRLGGTAWAQRKSRVKKVMRDMADELLKLYAARQSISIQPCGEDSHWQREFADSFPFALTEDQARAIEDVRRDLESPRPMDRLLVGDVGYGKTEVAMRAAFKVAAEGRQVAVLAPTTVLALQHFETFQRRFAAFPLRIEMLSRFRSPGQMRESIARAAAGQVDIMVGTHRLLSQDVQLPSLGLLVVDEEQRFGVRHKERMKQLKREVHVLAMSATPIPRTLNMSLAGLRDLSVIETPPKDRLAIQTVVTAWDEEIVRTALETELARGGQVFYVHNRVDSIFETAARLQELAPAARIVVGHGQMDSGKAGAGLEKIMLQFIRHEADVLVSTSIIENGLDIPLANTIIIENADRFGLSELYQLRGRVGRSNRRAYAYLLAPRQRELTPIARKRLAAMREFSDLGAGFKIAALDLELRGAGNLLGAEQSGHIEAVGFDLYIRMLEQTVRELKGEPQRAESGGPAQIHLGLDIGLPESYIAEEAQRLRMYKRIAEAETAAQRDDVLRELTDRYGRPPEAARNLFLYAEIKAGARALGILSLERRRDFLLARFSAQSGLDPQSLAALIRRTPGAQFTPQGLLKLPLAGASPVDAARRMLEELSVTLQANAAQVSARPAQPTAV